MRVYIYFHSAIRLHGLVRNYAQGKISCLPLDLYLLCTFYCYVYFSLFKGGFLTPDLQNRIDGGL
jgi:hypothetical protein